MQQNIDAEMKDMLKAERERNSFACQCLNVPMVLKTSYKVNADALRGRSLLCAIGCLPGCEPGTRGVRCEPEQISLGV
eukprot:COSAG01_NODE_670_length_14354_cov_14.787653_1_plen_78_part_00